MLAILLGILVGALTGVINGFLVTRIKLPPFIVTLGTLSIFTAIGLLYSGGASRPASDDAEGPDLDREHVHHRPVPADHRRRS